ncbi:HflBKC-binding inner membrane protein [Candidatus Photodesmus blepharus]|uniref:HflBKC-binding inner membrane protein n=1 Tax=Candidatus Photodesmus blepharonis TaxID=1179155 RepID=A0A084CNG0_9GAMM|nr:Bax inhibitor-1/YccA family protein [Candidatus Photodesmus blepharus]KEY91339.1 HflBKC-binding inner membrane protein [Candidatus Photodesmus blepharus]
MSNLIVAKTSAQKSIIKNNKVLRNTYALLSMTLLWSAIVASISMWMNLPRPGIIIMLVGFYGLLFLTEKNRNNSLGIVFTFLFTGFLGYTIAPILNFYVGLGMSDVIVTSLSGTAFSLIAASAYAFKTKRDLSKLGCLMFSLFCVLLLGVIANIFMHSTAMHLVISSLFIVFSTMSILVTTQGIVRGGETNYISATVALYVSIYNIFISLLSILGIMNND